MDFTFYIILASIIIFIAYTVKGLTGFAASLISVPLLSLFLDIKFVVPVVALTTFVAGIILFWKVRKEIQWDEMIIVLIFVVIGSFIGIKLLARFDSIFIKRVFGVFVALFSLKLLIGSPQQSTSSISKVWGAFAGLIGGILGGMFDTNGPPLVIYFSRKLEKVKFRATLVAIFFIDVIWRNILYAANGITTLNEVKFTLFLLPALIMGTFLGFKLNLRVNQKIFNKIVGGILLVTGILLVIR
ncbi:sulfite exporter TauE/SafE family protein [bacterium]|nr:sulfite exporter TauE/SafE family protein [bacterium]